MPKTNFQEYAHYLEVVMSLGEFSENPYLQA
jgi:hypothetical protein